MPNKNWRLVVTDLGSSTAVSETTVTAPNWMAALQAGRAQLGEEAIIPRGSSCSVAADGKVTVTDALARRTYTIVPDTARSFAVSRPMAPRIPCEVVPRRDSSVPPPADAPRVATPAALRAPRPITGATRPAFPAVGDEPPPAQSPAEPAASPALARQRTPSGPYRPPAPSSYRPPAPSSLAADRHALATRDGLRGSEPPSQSPPSPTSIAKPASAPPPAAMPLPISAPPPASVPLPVSAPPPEIEIVSPSSAPPPGVAVTESRSPPPAGTPADEQRPPNAAGSPAAPMPAPTSPSTAAAEPGDPATTPRAELGWELLTSRDESPTADAPLNYRERTYFVAEGTSPQAAEAMLRERQAALEVELQNVPQGKYFNLAAFDHRWTGKPRRAPLVTLQWRDWRGAAEVVHRKARSAKARSATSTGGETRAATSPAMGGATGASGTPTSPTATARARSMTPTPRPRTRSAAPGEIPRPRKISAYPFEKTSEIDVRLTRAFEAAQDLAFLETPVEALEFVIALLQELVPSEAATASLYDINTDEFRLVALDGPGATELKGRAVPSGRGLLSTAAKRELPLRTESFTPDSGFDPEVDGRPNLTPRSLLYRPLVHGGRLLGMLQLINRARREGYTDDDVNVLGYVADRLAEFLLAVRITADQPSPPNPVGSPLRPRED